MKFDTPEEAAKYFTNKLRDDWPPILDTEDGISLLPTPEQSAKEIANDENKKKLDGHFIKTEEKNSGGPTYPYQGSPVSMSWQKVDTHNKETTLEQLLPTPEQSAKETEWTEKRMSEMMKEEIAYQDKITMDILKNQPYEMSIVLYPDPVLRQKCLPVEEITEEIVKFCNDLHLYAKKSRCLGLSAPQVGYPKRIIVVNEMIQGLGTRPHILINPVISNASGKSKYKEGCLSLPGIYSQVERFNSFDVSYKDIEGKEHTEHVEDVSKEIFGTVLQHELDHLDGRLFIDIISAYEKDKVIKKINKLRPRK